MVAGRKQKMQSAKWMLFNCKEDTSLAKTDGYVVADIMNILLLSISSRILVFCANMDSDASRASGRSFSRVSKVASCAVFSCRSAVNLSTQRFIKGTNRR